MRKYRILFFLFLFLVYAYAEDKTIAFSAARMSGTAGKTTGTTALEGSAPDHRGPDRAVREGFSICRGYRLGYRHRLRKRIYVQRRLAYL